PSRAAFRALIRSRTSGFTFTGPQEGSCPTINSLATRNDLSRAWNTGAALPASGQARRAPAAEACAARFSPTCDAVTRGSVRMVSEFEFRLGRRGWENSLGCCEVSPQAAGQREALRFSSFFPSI